MAVGDAHVCPGFLTPVLTQLSFQSHQLLFSHASEVRGENTPERKVAWTGDRTHNHQVMSETRPPLNHPGRAILNQSLFSINRDQSIYRFVSDQIYLRYYIKSMSMLCKKSKNLKQTIFLSGRTLYWRGKKGIDWRMIPITFALSLRV